MARKTTSNKPKKGIDLLHPRPIHVTVVLSLTLLFATLFAVDQAQQRQNTASRADVPTPTQNCVKGLCNDYEATKSGVFPLSPTATDMDR